MALRTAGKQHVTRAINESRRANTASDRQPALCRFYRNNTRASDGTERPAPQWPRAFNPRPQFKETHQLVLLFPALCWPSVGFFRGGGGTGLVLTRVSNEPRLEIHVAGLSFFFFGNRKTAVPRFGRLLRWCSRRRSSLPQGLYPTESQKHGFHSSK